MMKLREREREQDKKDTKIKTQRISSWSLKYIKKSFLVWLLLLMHQTNDDNIKKLKYWERKITSLFCCCCYCCREVKFCWQKKFYNKKTTANMEYRKFSTVSCFFSIVLFISKVIYMFCFISQETILIMKRTNVVSSVYVNFLLYSMSWNNFRKMQSPYFPFTINHHIFIS